MEIKKMEDIKLNTMATLTEEKVPSTASTSLGEKEVKMTEEEFKRYLATHLNLKIFTGVSRFKSIKRAFKRGHVSPYGEVYPRRPFNNRANTSNRSNKHSRTTNQLRKQIYGELTKYKRAI